MHALILLCVKQHTTFEVSGFTNYKDMIEAKFKKRVTWPLSPLFRGDLSP